MRFPLSSYFPQGAVLSGAVWLALTATSAFGQQLVAGGPGGIACPPSPCPAPERVPAAPPEAARPETPRLDMGQAAPQEPALSLAPERALALGGATTARAESNVGYIDAAIPRTQFRLRFDAAYDDNRPDRAEFFYPKCGCFGGGAPGPPLSETSVDYQELSSYLEVAVGDRFSGFVEVPVRFLNPEQNTDQTGIGDMNAGFKFAFVACEDRYVTFQLRTYIPTGDAFRGLGTRHVSLEPALLAYQQLTDRLAIEGEFRDWIPINGTDFAGNVIRYGVGLGYHVVNSQALRITPVAEFVGWTVLGGKEAAMVGTQTVAKDASGDTIVNVKLGSRFTFCEHNEIYVGYGRALTGAVWYKDILRLEYRLLF